MITHVLVMIEHWIDKSNRKWWYFAKYGSHKNDVNCQSEWASKVITFTDYMILALNANCNKIGTAKLKVSSNLLAKTHLIVLFILPGRLLLRPLPINQNQFCLDNMLPNRCKWITLCIYFFHLMKISTSSNRLHWIWCHCFFGALKSFHDNSNWFGQIVWSNFHFCKWCLHGSSMKNSISLESEVLN